MSLPVIQHATFEVVQPSTGNHILLRRFLICEEKIFMIAKQSEDPREISRACVQVVNNCIQSGQDVMDMTTFDLDWLFLKLRSQSVDNMVSATYEDPDDGETYTLSVSLEEVSPPLPTMSPPVIVVDGKIKMRMKFPSVRDMEEIYQRTSEEQEEAPDIVSLFVSKCVESIFDEEQVYEADSEDELIKFLSTLQSSTYKEIQQFVDSLPELTHTAVYKNNAKEDREIVLRGIESFFTF